VAVRLLLGVEEESGVSFKEIPYARRYHMPIVISKSDYRVDDPFQVQRWMCPYCGLIFDFLDDYYGHPMAGGIEEVEYYYCPRCESSFDEWPLIPIEVRKAPVEGPTQATFYVEDKMQRLVVEGVAEVLGKEVEVRVLGDRNAVENLYRYSQRLGGQIGGCFVVDWDGKDSKYADAENFVQLDRYCIENYLLNPQISAAVLGMSSEQVRTSILSIVSGNRKAITRGDKYREFFVERLLKEGDLDTFLTYVDAKIILRNLLRERGVKKESFVKEYVRRSYIMSVMKQVLPEKLVALIEGI